MTYLDILVNKNIIEAGEEKKLKKKADATEKFLDEILLEKGVAEEEIHKAKEEFFNLPFRKLDPKNFTSKVLKHIPEKSVIHYSIIPLQEVEGFLEVGIIDPGNIEARDALEFISSKINLPYKLFIISKSDFKKALEGYKGLSGEVSQALTELESDLDDEEAKISEAVSKVRKDNEATFVEDAPVTKIVATILRYAAEDDTSDVHIEHTGEKVRVRFRIDGILDTRLVLPAKVHSAVVARIKILSKMRLDEKRKPQDGRFSANIDDRRVDFRVSTFPAYYGEKVVMRILEPDKGIAHLSETGLSEKNLNIVKKAIERPHGMILISGPTGSGKTTTLYSILHEIDRMKKNVLSLEDPVELNIEGVSQSQVRPEIGYTFASGLRTTLRQDPDVIMVGEIRDKETAGLAVQAALTGHLVFSTIHTNDAAGVIPRLIEMEVDPFLIAPTLSLAIAQRLVRKLAPGSGKEIPVEGSIKLLIDKEFETLPEKFRNEIDFPKTVLEATPVKGNPQGLKGRTGVFEVIEMDRDIEEVVLKNAVNTEIEALVRSKGMITMKEDGLIKAFNKIIPFEEANKL
ncbi:MAG: GspE/PulE family protein [Patescibacteria group bacterium]|nr:GspE/PulE family protein [Patescibacteria group bacterium]